MPAAVRQGLEFGLLQVLEETGLSPLYLPPGVWRTWLAEQLTDAERKAAHESFRQAIEIYRRIAAESPEGT